MTPRFKASMIYMFLSPYDMSLDVLRYQLNHQVELIMETWETNPRRRNACIFISIMPRTPLILARNELGTCRDWTIDMVFAPNASVARSSKVRR